MDYSDTHWDWSSTVAGRVVAIAGHVHDNGISIAAENVTRGTKICTSRAGYQKGSMFAPAGRGSGVDRFHPADWWHMTRGDHPDATLASYEGHIGSVGCTPHSRLEVGDTIRLHALYNLGNMTHGTGQMGILVAYVAQT